MEHFLEAEFQHFNEGEEVLSDYHLEEFMLAGYPDTDRERIRKGVRVVLEEFGDGTRLTWQDLSRMYTVSWHTDPNSVQSEFINRGFRCLNRVGPVLNDILSFGFNPYVIQIQKGDTEQIIQEKCTQCIERMTSKILILIVSKSRSSLMVPCFAQKFIYMYFNPSQKRKLDSLICRSFRSVCDLGIPKVTNPEDVTHAISTFVQCLSHHASGALCDTGVSYALRPEAIAEALQEYLDLAPTLSSPTKTAHAVENHTVPIIQTPKMKKKPPRSHHPPKPELAPFPPRLLDPGSEKQQVNDVSKCKRKGDPVYYEGDPVQYEPSPSRLKKPVHLKRNTNNVAGAAEMNMSEYANTTKIPKIVVRSQMPVLKQPNVISHSRERNVSESLRRGTRMSASPAPSVATSIGGSVTSIDSFKFRFNKDSASRSIESFNKTSASRSVESNV